MAKKSGFYFNNGGETILTVKDKNAEECEILDHQSHNLGTTHKNYKLHHDEGPNLNPCSLPAISLKLFFETPLENIFHVDPKQQKAAGSHNRRLVTNYQLNTIFCLFVK